MCSARCWCRRSCAPSTHADGGSAYINKLLTLALVVIGVATILATALAPAAHAAIVRGLEPARSCPRDRLRVVVPAADLLLRALHAARRGAQRPAQLRAVHLGARAEQRRRASSASSCSACSSDSTPTARAPSTTGRPGMVALLAGSATLGIAVQAVVLFWFWRRIGLRYRPDFAWRGVGLGAAGTDGRLDVRHAAAHDARRHRADPGRRCTASGTGASVAAIDNAWLIFMLPHSVITVSIATAYFTRMSEHAHAGDLDRVRDDLSSAVRGVSAHHGARRRGADGRRLPVRRGVPAAVSTDASALGNVIIAFAIGLVAFSILFVVQRTFYALGDTRTPFFFTLFQVDRLHARGAQLPPAARRLDRRRRRARRPRSPASPSSIARRVAAAPAARPRSTGGASPCSLGRDLAAVVLAGHRRRRAPRRARRHRPTAASRSRGRVGAIVSMAVIGVVDGGGVLRHPVAAPLARASRLRRAAARAAASG